VSFKSVLKRLIPLVLGGKFDEDLGIEGDALDAVQARIAALQPEMFPDTAEELLHKWEQLYEIVPVAGATIAARQEVVTGKFRSTGDIKKPHYVALAASLGYTIRIDDYTESMAGWQCAGDELLEDGWIYFTAGIGAAGDTLAFEDVVLPWIWEVVVTVVPDNPPSPDLEQVLQDLKPDHIMLNFTYL
jgi:uncharacterized protein YmfQ (DUF2313 family)